MDTGEEASRWIASAPYVLAISVAVLNVWLNFAVKSAASAGGDYIASVTSWRFLGAFCLGTLSLLTLLALYSTGVAVARAILLAGAGSIVIGTIVALLLEPTGQSIWSRLPTTEWLLLTVISVLFAIRLVRTYLS